MSGIKGRSGSGGQRRGAGRPRSVLHLDSDTAHTIALIVLYRRSINPTIRAEDLVSQWAKSAWQELDAQSKK